MHTAHTHTHPSIHTHTHTHTHRVYVCIDNDVRLENPHISTEEASETYGAADVASSRLTWEKACGRKGRCGGVIGKGKVVRASYDARGLRANKGKGMDGLER